MSKKNSYLHYFSDTSMENSSFWVKTTCFARSQGVRACLQVADMNRRVRAPEPSPWPACRGGGVAARLPAPLCALPERLLTPQGYQKGKVPC